MSDIVALTRQKDHTDQEILDIRIKIAKARETIVKQKAEGEACKQGADILLKQEQADQEKVAATFKAQLVDKLVKLVNIEQAHAVLVAKIQRLETQLRENIEQHQTALATQTATVGIFTAEKEQAIRAAQEADVVMQAAITKVVQLQRESNALAKARREDAERANARWEISSQTSSILSTKTLPSADLVRTLAQAVRKQRHDAAQDGNEITGTQHGRRTLKPKLCS